MATLSSMIPWHLVLDQCRVVSDALGTRLHTLNSSNIVGFHEISLAILNDLTFLVTAMPNLFGQRFVFIFLKVLKYSLHLYPSFVFWDITVFKLRYCINAKKDIERCTLLYTQVFYECFWNSIVSIISNILKAAFHVPFFYSLSIPSVITALHQPMPGRCFMTEILFYRCHYLVL